MFASPQKAKNAINQPQRAPRSQALPGDALPRRLCLRRVRPTSLCHSTAEPCIQRVPRQSLGTRVNRSEESADDAMNRLLPKSIVCLREGYTRQLLLRELFAGVAGGGNRPPPGVGFLRHPLSP